MGARSVMGPFSLPREGRWRPVWDGVWGGEDVNAQTLGCGRSSGVRRDNQFPAPSPLPSP